METLLTAILLPAFAALLGAWAGSRAALDQLKSERSFDRRLSWYDDARSALRQFRSVLSSAIHYERLHGFNEEATKRWLAAIAAYRPITDAIDQAEAYAPNRSVLRLVHLHRDFMAFNDRLDALGPGIAGRDEWIEAAEDLVGAARDSSICLAADVRTHLGVDSLDTAMLKSGAVLPPLPRP